MHQSLSNAIKHRILWGLPKLSGRAILLRISAGWYENHLRYRYKAFGAFLPSLFLWFLRNCKIKPLKYNVLHVLLLLVCIFSACFSWAGAIPKTTDGWNLKAVRADELWGLGHTGEGLVVASMDTGVDLNHPDLKDRWRGGTNSWYDPQGEHELPYDADGHGTQSMGIVLGGAAGGHPIGVAPGARWIAARIFDDSGETSIGVIHKAFQWLLDPDGDPATDDAPDIVYGSWGLNNINSCSTEFQPDIESLNKAGIAVIFSAGNSGPAPSSDISPANGPGSFSVGATDSLFNVEPQSSRGPSACGSGIYPDVTAPGADIKTSDITPGCLFPDSYAVVSGTSFAAPHAAGAMALLMGAFPSVSVREIELALRQSAADLGEFGPDNTYGYGLMNVRAAYDALLNPAPAISVSGDSYDFGFINMGGLPAVRKIIVLNRGNAELVISSLALGGTGSPSFITRDDTCSGAVLAPSGTCGFGVLFSPASAGEQAAYITVRSNAQGTPLVIPLSGAGSLPMLTLLTPNGGETVPSGSAHNITWAPQAGMNIFKLQYSMNKGKTWKTIRGGLKTTSYNWKTPVTSKNRTNVLVRVVGYKAPGKVKGSDRSDSAFTILATLKTP